MAAHRNCSGLSHCCVSKNIDITKDDSKQRWSEINEKIWLAEDKAECLAFWKKYSKIKWYLSQRRKTKIIQIIKKYYMYSQLNVYIIVTIKINVPFEALFSFVFASFDWSSETQSKEISSHK